MSNIERWRPTQYPDYLVSDKGRVKSLKYTQGKHFRILAQNPDKDGYMCVTLFPDKKYTKAKVHRLVAEAFVRGKTAKKKFACHKDGNNQNNHWTNLKWATPRENVMDMAKHGTNKQWWTSENNVSRKLKLQSIKRIKRILKEDKTWGVQSRLAREYNVSPKTINDIKRGKNWANIS
jgi:hypothetical protein